MNDPGRRFYRSRSDKKIAGVCGGFAKYFGWDPVIPRIAMLVLFLGAGVGLLAYIVCWIAIPMEPKA